MPITQQMQPTNMMGNAPHGMLGGGVPVPPPAPPPQMLPQAPRELPDDKSMKRRNNKIRKDGSGIGK